MFSRLILLSLVAMPVGALAETVCRTVGSGLNVRSSPSIHSRRAAGLTEGTSFTSLGLSRNGAWMQVRMANGRTGWVSDLMARRAAAAAGVTIL